MIKDFKNEIYEWKLDEDAAKFVLWHKKPKTTKYIKTKCIRVFDEIPNEFSHRVADLISLCAEYGLKNSISNEPKVEINEEAVAKLKQLKQFFFN